MASIRKRIWETKGDQRVAWIADYTDQSGKRRQRTFQTRKAAVAWQAEAQHEIAKGIHTPRGESLTISEAAELWYRDRKLKGRERVTLRAYRLHIDGYIAPVIGSVPLVQFTAADKTPLAETGQWEFASSRNPSACYLVTYGRAGHLECTCQGFTYRGNCKHAGRF